MQHVLVTGASTGIGYATCKYLIEKGFFVFGSCRKQADIERLEKDFPNNFQGLLFDVTDEEAIKNAAQIVEKNLNGKNLKALIHNAGIAKSGILQHLPTEELKYQFEVNIFGVHRINLAFLPLLGAKKSSDSEKGKIINISSVNGFISTPLVGAYCASKHALEAMTDVLRRELIIYGIDVISIQPGPVKTPIWEKIDDVEPYMQTDYAQFIKENFKIVEKSLKNAVEPEVVAERIYKVIVSDKPNTRYIITKTNFLLKIVRNLPPRWIDKMLVGKYRNSLK